MPSRGNAPTVKAENGKSASKKVKKMKALAKAQAALSAANTARECAHALNARRPMRLTTAGKEWPGLALTPRTIRKARQGKILALRRVADALILTDDAQAVL